MIKPHEQRQSPYKLRLKQIARIAQYQAVASIPQPSRDFNYTISKNRYSQYYETPKIIKKQAVNKSDHLKLTTILETHGGSPLFPKISKTKQAQGQGSQSIKGKVKGLRTHFKREQDTTVASRERSLTIDTRLQTEQRNSEQRELLLQSVQSRRNRVNISQSLQRNANCFSNSSQLSSAIYRRNQSLSKQNKSQYIHHQPTLYEEDQEDEDQQYQKDAVPGPGSYQYFYSDFDKKRTTASTNVSFLSKLTRFNYKKEQNKQSQPQPKNSLEVEKQIKRTQRLRRVSRKKLIPFNSMSPRSFEYEVKLNQKIPGPQQYYVRQGMEEDLIRVIQRQFKGNFGSQQPRFGENKPDSHLGPGCYQKIQEEETLAGENYFFKSKKNRFEE